MDSQHICQSCQKPLAPDAPMGLCPECLMKAGFPTGIDTGTSKVPGRLSFVPPSLEEIAPRFPQLEILEFIGQGGMGAVYKARQKQLDRVVALKILPPGIGDDPAFSERFAREARALAKLNHPGIVTLYEFGEQPGTKDDQPSIYYFLMEFVDGVTLRQLLNAGRVSSREALAIVPQICDALQFAHDQGIVHRDIKPENILLDRRGRVKVADFGLAKIIEPDRADLPVSPNIRAAQQHGPTGVMGTPNYMAPEQIEQPSEVDHRADIYALGVVFYQMLTGELPGKRIEAPSSKVQIDVRLDEIVLRALEKKPELRYQQISVFKTQVETISRTEKSERTESNPHFSWTAITGFCLGMVTLLFFARLALGLVSLVANYDNVTLNKKALMVAAALGVVCLLISTILGWVAVSQILRSAGKLYGMWLAVFDGLLFPLLALDGLIVGAVFLGILVVVKLKTSFATPVGIPIILLVPVAIGVTALADFLIIRRVWRAVNKGVTGVLPAGAIASPKDKGQKGSRFTIKRLRWSVPAFVLVAISALIMWHVYSKNIPLWVVHYRVFEVDGALADNLVPLTQRQTGMAGNWQRAEIDKETLASLVAGRVLNKHVMVDRYCKVPIRSSKTKVITQKPGVEEPQQRVIVDWPIVTDNWGHTLENHVANDIMQVNGNVCFGVRRKEGKLEWRVEHTLEHRIGIRPAVVVNIDYEGPAPKKDAMAFFIPFARKDDTTGYFVFSVEAEEKAAGGITSNNLAFESKLPPANLTFGPVMERVITPFDENPGQSCLDVGSGEFHSPPEALADSINLIASKEFGESFADIGNPGEERYDWLKNSGVDFIGSHDSNGGEIFKYIGQPPSFIGGWTFENVSPSKVFQTVQSSPFFAGDKHNMPNVYINVINPNIVKKSDCIVFRTHDGDVGVMQVLGASDDPRGVKIRYKLVQSSVMQVTPVRMPVVPNQDVRENQISPEDTK